MKILCFNIDEDFIKYGICNENYELIETHKTPSDEYKSKDSLIGKLADIANGYSNISRIAVSITGWVNSDTGVVSSPAIFGSEEEIPLKDLIEGKAHIEAFIENNVNATALTISEFGEARNEKNFVCLSLSEKIRASVFIDGKLYRGACFSAGEISCSESINDTGINEISSILSNLIYTLNPALIVLIDSDSTRNISIEEINKSTKCRLPDKFRKTRIIRTAFSNDAALIGAAYLSEN